MKNDDTTPPGVYSYFFSSKKKLILFCPYLFEMSVYWNPFRIQPITKITTMEQHREELVSKLASRLQAESGGKGLPEKIATPTVLAVPYYEPSPEEVAEAFEEFIAENEKAELNACETEKDQKIADLTARLIALEKLVVTPNPPSGDGKPVSWVDMEESASREEDPSFPEQLDASASAECSSPPEEPEFTFGFFQEDSIDVASSQVLSAASAEAVVKQSSMVNKKPCAPQKIPASPSKGFLKGSEKILWGTFVTEVDGKKKTFLKIDRKDWNNLASFAPLWFMLSKEMQAHLRVLWKKAEDLGYLTPGRQDSITKGKALFSNPDARNSDLTIESNGAWKGFPFVGNDSKSSMHGQGLVGLDCFCPICFEQGILLPWPYSPYTWDEMVAKWEGQLEGGR